MKKVLFTECLFDKKDIELLKTKGFDIIPAPGDLDEDQLIEKLKGCSVYIIGGADKATSRVINSTNLELIVFYGTGYENYVDIDAAKKKGLLVSYTPKANAYTVAEHAVSLIIDAVKNTTYLNNTTKSRKWIRRDTWNFEGKTLGIVGMGTIGGYVAGIMKRAFAMKIQYVSRERKFGLEKELDAKKVGLKTLMATSDVVSIHASYSKETVGMIGKKELFSMQPHSVLVCTSRTELVDPKALKEALEKGKLSAAAFDGYYKEPVPTKKNDVWGLLSLPDNKFIITPHTGYGSKEAKSKMNTMVIENMLTYTSGKPKYSVI